MSAGKELVPIPQLWMMFSAGTLFLQKEEWELVAERKREGEMGKAPPPNDSLCHSKLIGMWALSSSPSTALKEPVSALYLH